MVNRQSVRHLVIVAGALVILAGVHVGWLGSTSPPAGAQSVPPAAQAAVSRGTFVRSLRLHGLVEAVDFYSVVTPRLAGAGNNRLTIVRLAAKGTLVRQGDLLVEFDRQQQVRDAMDKRAEWMDLEEQIRKKRADQAAAQAQDETALKSAENAAAVARLEMIKNPMLPAIEAEKNSLTLEAAEAKFAQLQTTFSLKRKAAQADLQILEVRRDRAASAMNHARRNAEKMVILSPIDGLVVLKAVWKGDQMGEAQEGEEMWPGSAVLDVVGPSSMRVRVRVNQADLAGLQPGLSARVTLDAYPGKSYPGRLEQVAPIGVASQFSPKVRSFIAIFGVKGVDPQLAPDLSAAVDVELERVDNALIAPRDAITFRDGRSYLRVKRGSSTDEREVALGPMNDLQVVIKSGVEAGVEVESRLARHSTTGS